MKPRHFIPALLFLLIAYPLSIGPVASYRQWSGGGANDSDGFYRPLWRLCRTWQPLEDALLAYTKLWLPKEP